MYKKLVVAIMFLAASKPILSNPVGYVVTQFGKLDPKTYTYLSLGASAGMGVLVKTFGDNPAVNQKLKKVGINPSDIKGPAAVMASLYSGSLIAKPEIASGLIKAANRVPLVVLAYKLGFSKKFEQFLYHIPFVGHQIVCENTIQIMDLQDKINKIKNGSTVINDNEEKTKTITSYENQIKQFEHRCSGSCAECGAKKGLVATAIYTTGEVLTQLAMKKICS